MRKTATRTGETCFFDQAPPDFGKFVEPVRIYAWIEVAGHPGLGAGGPECTGSGADAGTPTVHRG